MSYGMPARTREAPIDKVYQKWKFSFVIGSPVKCWEEEQREQSVQGLLAFPLEGVTLPMGLAGVHFLAQATVWALLLLLVILSHGLEAFVQVVPTPCWPYSEPFSAHSSLALLFKAGKLNLGSKPLILRDLIIKSVALYDILVYVINTVLCSHNPTCSKRHIQHHFLERGSVSLPRSFWREE